MFTGTLFGIPIFSNIPTESALKRIRWAQLIKTSTNFKQIAFESVQKKETFKLGRAKIRTQNIINFNLNHLL